jgi:hypothetical protein
MFAMLALTLPMLSGCAGPAAEGAGHSDEPKGTWANQAKARAAFDLGCSQEQIKMSYIKKADFSGGPVFGARGCGKRASYSADTVRGVVLQSGPTADEATATTP